MVSSRLYNCLVIVTLLAFVSASPFKNIFDKLYPRGDPIFPLDDPFYSPALSTYESALPGTILDSRGPPAQLAAFGKIPLNLSAAHQLLYRTTDALGNAQATVTTVLVPYNANFSRFVSYQDYENAVYLNCAPSYGLQDDTNLKTAETKADSLLTAGMLSNGWPVAIPDHEGPVSATFSGIQGAHATLDGIRAVLNSKAITGIEATAEIQMWGYSGGSIPTEYAAEIQPTYAPELNIKSAVIGGTIANLSSCTRTINKSTYSGFAVGGLLGLAASYPNLVPVLDAALKPENKSAFYAANETCGVGLLLDYSKQDIGDYFIDGFETILTDAAYVAADLAGGQMGLHGLPQIPLYFYKAIKDDIDIVDNNDLLVTAYCAAGIGSLVYRRDKFGKHVSEQFTGVGGALGYITDIFDGVAPPEGCDIKDVTITGFDLSAFGGFADTAKGIFRELFRQALEGELLDKADD